MSPTELQDGEGNAGDLPERRRKAWRVWAPHHDNSDIFFAPNASKARADAWRSLSDVMDVKIMQFTALRARERDVLLPVRDPIVDQMSDREQHCLLHAFGADQGDPFKAGSRDYFYTTRDDPPLVALTNLGLMEPMDGDRWGEGMTYFVLTARGKHVALSLVPEYGR